MTTNVSIGFIESAKKEMLLCTAWFHLAPWRTKFTADKSLRILSAKLLSKITLRKWWSTSMRRIWFNYSNMIQPKQSAKLWISSMKSTHLSSSVKPQPFQLTSPSFKKPSQSLFKVLLTIKVCSVKMKKWVRLVWKTRRHLLPSDSRRWSCLHNRQGKMR